MPRYSYLRARFDSARPFVAELEADSELVERSIVRVAVTTRPTNAGATQRLELRAGAIVDGRPVVLERFIGDLWGHAQDEDVRSAGERDRDELKTALGALGFDVRDGLLEVDGDA